MAQSQEPINFQMPELPIKWLENHEFFNEKRQPMCFCKKPLRQFSQHSSCANRMCGLKISNRLLNTYKNENIFISSLMSFPICIICNKCYMDYFFTPNTGELYHKPIFRCNCKDTLRITPKVYQDKLDSFLNFSNLQRPIEHLDEANKALKKIWYSKKRSNPLEKIEDVFSDAGITIINPKDAHKYGINLSKRRTPYERNNEENNEDGRY